MRRNGRSSRIRAEGDNSFALIQVIKWVNNKKAKHIVNTYEYRENPLQVVDDFIKEYDLETGEFDITDVDRGECVL